MCIHGAETYLVIFTASQYNLACTVNLLLPVSCLIFKSGEESFSASCTLDVRLLCFTMNLRDVFGEKE